MYINVLFWNVRRIVDINKYALVKDAIIESKCDIVCLQETKWKQHSIFRLKIICPNKFKEYHTRDETSTKGGILISCTSKYKCHLLQQHIYTTIVILICQQQNFMLTCVYGPTSDVNKLNFLNELREIRTISSDMDNSR
jgi:exonuclease III